jgi:hypothetical protein
VVRLSRALNECAIPSDAKLREDGRAPVEHRAGKDFAAVLGNKNQVREKSKASVSARPKSFRVVHEPSIPRSWFASTAIGSTQRVRKTRRCERRSIGCVNCTTLRLSIEPEAYRRQRVRVSAYGQMRELAAVREVRPEYASIHTHLLQDAITRLDRAYRAFFRRVKAGETPARDRAASREARRPCDATAKAERAGREVVAVDPRGTSQYCSGCGVEGRKSLAVRVHECSACGLRIDRDLNAAKNIQARGHRVRGGFNGRSEDPRSPYFAVCGK